MIFGTTHRYLPTGEVSDEDTWNNGSINNGVDKDDDEALNSFHRGKEFLDRHWSLVPPTSPKNSQQSFLWNRVTVDVPLSQVKPDSDEWSYSGHSEHSYTGRLTWPLSISNVHRWAVLLKAKKTFGCYLRTGKRRRRKTNKRPPPQPPHNNNKQNTHNKSHQQQNSHT